MKNDYYFCSNFEEREVGGFSHIDILVAFPCNS